MSKVKFTPQGDRVLVEPAQAEDKTASGIIIPDTAKEKPQKGTVIAIGPGKKKDEPEVRARPGGVAPQGFRQAACSATQRRQRPALTEHPVVLELMRNV